MPSHPRAPIPLLTQSKPKTGIPPTRFQLGHPQTLKTPNPSHPNPKPAPKPWNPQFPCKLGRSHPDPKPTQEPRTSVQGATDTRLFKPITFGRGGGALLNGPPHYHLVLQHKSCRLARASVDPHPARAGKGPTRTNAARGGGGLESSRWSS